MTQPDTVRVPRVEAYCIGSVGWLWVFHCTPRQEDPGIKLRLGRTFLPIWGKSAIVGAEAFLPPVAVFLFPLDVLVLLVAIHHWFQELP